MISFVDYFTERTAGQWLIKQRVCRLPGLENNARLIAGGDNLFNFATNGLFREDHVFLPEGVKCTVLIDDSYYFLKSSETNSKNLTILSAGNNLCCVCK